NLLQASLWRGRQHEKLSLMKHRIAKETTSNAVSRRKFLAASAAAVGALTVVPRHVLGGPRFVAPSEKVNIAIVGCGGQGQVNVRNLFTQDDAQIIAVADPIEYQDLHAFYFNTMSG